jgi:hypothetical protein
MDQWGKIEDIETRPYIYNHLSQKHILEKKQPLQHIIFEKHAQIKTRPVSHLSRNHLK